MKPIQIKKNSRKPLLTLKIIYDLIIFDVSVLKIFIQSRRYSNLYFGTLPINLLLILGLKIWKRTKRISWLAIFMGTEKKTKRKTLEKNNIKRQKYTTKTRF